MTDPSTTIALTGGSGFIGKRFAVVARAKGYRIRHLTRHAAEDFAPEDEVCPFDLEAPTHDAAMLQDCTALVHLAAYIPPDHSDPAAAERCWAINAGGTLRLIEKAATAGVKRIVQTTSANAYADGVDMPDENAPMFPRSRSYYLGSKILQEIYATEFCRTRGMALTTLRLASVYGPGQTTGALGIMVRAAVEGRPMEIIDGGQFGADLVHVDDVVQALMLAVERDCSGPINVGSGVRTTIKTLARMIADLTGGSVIERPGEGTSGDTGFPPLDIMRLRSLGCDPSPLSAGLSTILHQH
ncbi:NAD(P)-dependent oxidoreductase [Sphingobium aromaticiconvertens]|uniref:NAD-dependent epimerase/dehydratase family protein n=1 Tax=Sphingobium aromaticiconvertens TaxID=365341 RepID=UPI00301AE109